MLSLEVFFVLFFQKMFFLYDELSGKKALGDHEGGCSLAKKSTTIYGS
jgi:hypothetical protein